MKEVALKRKTNHQSVMAAYSDGFLERHGARPHLNGRDGMAVGRLLAQHGLEAVLAAMPAYLDASGWEAAQGWPLWGLEGAWNRIHTGARPARLSPTEAKEARERAVLDSFVAVGRRRRRALGDGNG